MPAIINDDKLVVVAVVVPLFGMNLCFGLFIERPHLLLSFIFYFVTSHKMAGFSFCAASSFDASRKNEARARSRSNDLCEVSEVTFNLL